MPLPRSNVGKPQGYGRHGVNLSTVEAMRRGQDNKCLICERPLPMVPTIDHDHRLAASHPHDVKRGCPHCIRGLLDEHCNKLLGFARDDEQTLLRAVAYLRANRQRLG